MVSRSLVYTRNTYFLAFEARGTVQYAIHHSTAWAWGLGVATLHRRFFNRLRGHSLLMILQLAFST